LQNKGLKLIELIYMKPKNSMKKFIAEAKLIEGAENAIFEVSEELENCMILTGEIYGKQTRNQIDEVGRRNGILVLARELSILYERPDSKS
jgi:hypothetical protein